MWIVYPTKYIAKNVTLILVNQLTKLIQLKIYVETKSIFIVNLTSLFLTILFFGISSPYKAIFYRDSLEFEPKYLQANNIITIIFFLTKKLNKPLILINLNYIFINKNPIFNILLLIYKVPIVSKVKYYIANIAIN